jgi:hypothetical protein
LKACRIKLNGTYASIVISVAVCRFMFFSLCLSMSQILDGVGRSLDPNLNLMTSAIPFLW